MRLSIAIFLTLHGLIHLFGFAKVFRLARLPQLTQPISPAAGVLWLVAALLFLAAAATLYVWPRGWWAFGAAAIIVSLVVIVPAWADARFGALADVVAAVAVAVGLLTQGPGSLRAEYDRDVARALVQVGPDRPVIEADLRHLPAPVQRYLRASGVVGQPRVQNLRARMHGRIRSGPTSRWMPFVVEQYNVYGERARFFYMDASLWLVPIQALHRYAGATASMRVRAAGLVPVVDMSGVDMLRAETVTLFNDMCLLAPATLIDPSIVWEPVDGNRVDAIFTNAGQTIRAELFINDVGELTNFWSDDRLQASADGRTLRSMRWSTPIADYRAFGPVRLGSRGEGRWHDPAGEYAYIQLQIDDVRYNVRR